MQVTEVRITLRDEPKLKAFANITFDESFVIRGLKVINGQKGFFVSMPSRKRTDGSFQDIVHPVSIDLRKHIEVKVLEAYDRKLREGNLS